MDIKTCSKIYFCHICRWRPIYWKSLFSVCSLVLLECFTQIPAPPANSRNKMMNNLKIRLLSPSNNRWQCCCLSWEQGRDERDTSTSHTWKEHFSDDWTFIKKTSWVLLAKTNFFTKGTTDADIQCKNSSLNSASKFRPTQASKYFLNYDF